MFGNLPNRTPEKEMHYPVKLLKTARCRNSKQEHCESKHNTAIIPNVVCVVQCIVLDNKSESHPNDLYISNIIIVRTQTSLLMDGRIMYFNPNTTLRAFLAYTQFKNALNI